MAREQKRDPQGDEKVTRLMGLKRAVQLVTMGFIVIFIILSFVLPPDFGRIFFPLVLMSLSVYTIVSGYVAFETGLSGIGAVDARPGWARGLGGVWMFAGFFLAIFGISYFV